VSGRPRRLPAQPPHRSGCAGFPHPAPQAHGFAARRQADAHLLVEIIASPAIRYSFVWMVPRFGTPLGLGTVVVLAADDGAPEGTLSGVVVERDLGIVDEERQLGEGSRSYAESIAGLRPRLRSPAYSSHLAPLRLTWECAIGSSAKSSLFDHRPAVLDGDGEEDLHADQAPRSRVGHDDGALAGFGVGPQQRG